MCGPRYPRTQLAVQTLTSAPSDPYTAPDVSWNHQNREFSRQNPPNTRARAATGKNRELPRPLQVIFVDTGVCIVTARQRSPSIVVEIAEEDSLLGAAPGMARALAETTYPEHLLPATAAKVATGMNAKGRRLRCWSMSIGYMPEKS